MQEYADSQSENEMKHLEKFYSEQQIEWFTQKWFLIGMRSKKRTYSEMSWCQTHNAKVNK